MGDSRFEDFGRTTQDYRQPHVALACFVNQFAAAQNAPPAQRFEHGQLPIIELRVSQALCVTVKLLVLVQFVHKHARNPVRTATDGFIDAPKRVKEG